MNKRTHNELRAVRAKKFVYVVLAALNWSCVTHEDVLVFENVNLFDGEIYHRKVNLVVRDSVVIDITRRHVWSENSRVIDGRNKTIIPPLLNAHVHVWKPAHLREALQAGVFALLDMHNTDHDSKNLRKYGSFPEYARFYSAGPGATVPGGHGTQWGPVPTINDSVSPEAFVAERIRHQADYIKILREPTMPVISLGQTQRVIEAAHKHSRLCVAHVTRLGDAMTLARQGIDGFVHIWIDRHISKSQLDSLASGKVFLVPTLCVYKKFYEASRSKEWLRNVMTFEELLMEAGKAYTAGIPVLAGTDAPNFRLGYGDDLYVELKLLRDAGLPALEVLKAATSNIYKHFRLDAFGRLEKNARADFTLIDGDPVANIDDIAKIESIWRNGKKIR